VILITGKVKITTINYTYSIHNNYCEQNLLFIHGWATDSQIFFQQFKYFETKLGILLVDLMAEESSTDNLDYSENVVNLIKQLNLKNIVVIGWSLGSLVAIKLVNILPERVSSLLLISATSKFISEKNYSCGQPLALVRQLKKSLKKDYETTLNRFYSQMFSSNEEERGYKALFIDNVLPRMNMLTKNRVVRGLDYLINTDCRHLLSHLTCPVTICHGQDDIICPVSSAYYLERNIPNSKLVIIDNCGHIPFLTYEARVNLLIEQLIK